jgi:hypothetical protein
VLKYKFNDHISTQHYVRQEFKRPPNYYAPLITLASIAENTRQIKVATALLVVPFRHPVLIAKELATLDHLTNGRLLVGVGIGGNFEYAPYLAKKALLRRIGERHPDPFYARLEKELLRTINRSGIGPMGLGGRITALDVFIEQYPRHLATLPVAVNLNCHVARHKTAVI